MSTTLLELFPEPNPAVTSKALNALGAKFSTQGGGATIFHDILGAPFARMATKPERASVVDVIAARQTSFVENIPGMDAARVVVWSSHPFSGLQLTVGDKRVADGLVDQRLEIHYDQDEPEPGINTIFLYTTTTPEADGLQVRVGPEGQIVGGAIMRNGKPVTDGTMRSFNAHVEGVVTVPGDLVIRSVSQSEQYPEVGFVHLAHLQSGNIGTMAIPLQVKLHLGR